MDFKAECHAGELVESLCSGPAAAPDVPLPGVDKQYVHVIRRGSEAGGQELVRCRTSWRLVGAGNGAHGNGNGAHSG